MPDIKILILISFIFHWHSITGLIIFLSPCSVLQVRNFRIPFTKNMQDLKFILVTYVSVCNQHVFTRHDKNWFRSYSENITYNESTSNKTKFNGQAWAIFKAQITAIISASNAKPMPIFAWKHIETKPLLFQNILYKINIVGCRSLLHPYSPLSTQEATTTIVGTCTVSWTLYIRRSISKPNSSNVLLMQPKFPSNTLYSRIIIMSGEIIDKWDVFLSSKMTTYLWCQISQKEETTTNFHTTDNWLPKTLPTYARHQKIVCRINSKIGILKTSNNHFQTWHAIGQKQNAWSIASSDEQQTTHVLGLRNPYLQHKFIVNKWPCTKCQTKIDRRTDITRCQIYALYFTTGNVSRAWNLIILEVILPWTECFNMWFQPFTNPHRVYWCS